MKTDIILAGRIEIASWFTMNKNVYSADGISPTITAGGGNGGGGSINMPKIIVYED